MKRLFSTFILALISALTVSAKSLDYAEFAKVFGVVQYYTPNPYTQQWTQEDWAYVASYLMYKADTESIGYEKLFAPLSPYVTVTPVPQSGYVKSSGETAYYWEHSGGGTISVSGLAKLLLPAEKKEAIAAIINHKTLLPAHSEKAPVADSIYSYELSPGSYLNVVHCQGRSNFSEQKTQLLLKNAKGLYWTKLGEPLKKYKQYWDSSANKYARLGSAIGIWNAVRHFYPYIDKIENEWDATLPKFIAIATNDSMALGDYYAEHLQLLNVLRDGHLVLWPNISIAKNGAKRYVPDYFVPLDIDYVDERVYVKTDAGRFKKFDVITKINGLPVGELIERSMSIAPGATEPALEFMAIGELLRTHTPNQTYIIEAVRLDGATIIDTLLANATDRPYPRPPKGERIKDIDNGVLFYDATQSGKPSKKEIEQLAAAKAVIYDIRTYPDYSFEVILSHLCGHLSEVKLPKFPRVITSRPFNIGAWQRGNNAEKLEALSPRITSKAYFLSSRQSISWAETVLQIVRANGLGEIIGETSSGTNGDITRFSLPIFQLTFTGRRAYNADGSDFFGIGVEPDHIVEQTWQSTIEGHDDLIEYTLNIIKNDQ